ncbi:MAG: response regulator [Bdellovibrionales bacterium]
MATWTDWSILVVDDEITLREILVDEFDYLGAKTYEASDGLEALKVLKEKKIDAIVSDVRMPNMDGIALVKEIQKQLQAPPPILLLSGYTDITKDEAKEIGAVDLMDKPWEMDKLLSVLDDAINK